MALQSLALGPNDRILMGESEYQGNVVAALQRCNQTGAFLEVVPSKSGTDLVDLSALSEVLKGGESPDYCSIV